VHISYLNSLILDLSVIAFDVGHWTRPIKLGIKSHLGCLELICTPAYSLHPKLHFDTNLIFVSLLVPEILAHCFCPSGKFFLEKMKDLCQDFQYIT
jgi:hypothetical protein